MNAAPRTPQDILDYWFGRIELTPAYFNERNKLWFGGTKKIDQFIRENYEPTVKAAVVGELESWLTTPETLTALVVALDQFSLNIYRDQARSFSQSAMAIPHVNRAITLGWDKKLTPAHRVFLYLPLEHSELLIDQARSIALFQALVEDSPAVIRQSMEGYLDYAVKHYDVVKRFGRFPDRNEIMNRPSTPEEAAYMVAGGPPF